MRRNVKKFAFFILAVVVGLAGSLWLARQVPIPRLVSPEIGINGGVKIEFSSEMRIASVAERLTLSPDPGYRLQWENRQLIIWPETAWEPGSVMTIRLKAGAEDLEGRKIRRDFQAQVNVRTPGMVYLSPISNGAGIWRITEFGGTPEKISSDPRGVIELAVSTDGEWIAYSLENEQEGADIWVMDRQGEDRRLLVECGASVCAEITWQPANIRIAYSQYIDGYQGIPSVWTVDVQTGEASRFLSDLQITSQFPAFSPDGSYLSVFSSSLGGLFLQNLEDGSSTILQTSISQAAVWSPDGTNILFKRSIELEGQAVDKIYRLDLTTKNISLAIGSEDDLYNYGTPAWNPNGGSIAIPVRSIEGGVSTQIWLFDPEGQVIQKIMVDPGYTYGGLHWGLDGNQLVIIRLAVDTSLQQPVILLWDQQKETLEPIAEDAAGPAWLP